MTRPNNTRTAAATRARMRKREERMADELRARGWTVHAPGDMVATLRGSCDGHHTARVAIYPAGVGETGTPIAAFVTPYEPVPDRPDRPAQVRPFVDALHAQGFELVGAWTSGVDQRGRWASVPVRRRAEP